LSLCWYLLTVLPIVVLVRIMQAFGWIVVHFCDPWEALVEALVGKKGILCQPTSVSVPPDTNTKSSSK
jgi:hypothetical protein